MIEALDLVHGLREAQKGRDGGRGARLWEFSRTSAWRYVAAVLEEAGVRRPQASPKGLRHGFGVQAVSSGVPLNMVQKWLGHAQLSLYGKADSRFSKVTGDEVILRMRRCAGCPTILT